MAFVAPGNYSRRQLDQAGERIREGKVELSDIMILENWRASHLYVINTFQSSLRSRRKRFNIKDITIAQRLKRRPTIVDKLRRESGMSLSRMHDIAGCRLIFESVKSLNEFRDGVLNSRAGHEHVGDNQRYNYIDHPKATGYRGIHDVYKYHVSSIGGQQWNGLRIEIQYRTNIQHSWATAVEISDIVNATRLKFNDASKNISRLFSLSSEILSRSYEDMDGPCPDLNNRELIEEFECLENQIHAISRLRNLTSNTFRKFARTSRLFILVNYTSGDKEGRSEAIGFYDSASAIKKYSELESELQDKADVVLVGASQQDAIRLAYTNYFSDASHFLTYLDAGINKIR